MNEFNGNQPERQQSEVDEGTAVPMETSALETTTTKPPVDIKVVEQYTLKHAGFWTRLWAYILDLVVLWSISRLLVYPIFRLAGWDLTGDLWYAPIAIISAVLFYAYFVLMTRFFGQTVGKMILGIKVVSLKGDQLTWSTILFREWVGRFISTAFPFLYVLYGLVAFTPKKQGVHDFIADTTVIHEGTYSRQLKKIFKKRESLSELQEPNPF